MQKLLSTLLLLCLTALYLSAQTDPCDRPDAPAKETGKLWSGPEKSTYYSGQTITFRVSSNQSGTVHYIIRESKRSPILEEGEFHLGANQEKKITYKFNRPGFLELTVKQNWKEHRSGVAISPCDIDGPRQRPADFHQFWDSLQQVSRALPLNARVNYRADKSNDRQKTYKLVMDNIDGKKVYGWVSVPNCAGPFPAVINLPSYGQGPYNPASNFAEDGAISISLSVHDYDCEKRIPSYLAYEPDEHFVDRETNYFKSAIVGALRAIDYLFTRPDFNGQDLALTGISQGGGLSIIVAGLDPRVTLLAQSQAAFCDQAASLADRPSGFPYWVKSGRDLGYSEERILQQTAYYDAVYFAELFQGPSLHVVGYRDDVCPPASVFAAVNRMGGKKQLIHGVDLGHSSHPDYWKARQQFFMSHLPVSRYPDCPAPATDDPGSDTDDDSNNNDNTGSDAGSDPEPPTTPPSTVAASVSIFPNPLTDRGNIELDLPNDSPVEITLWDSRGRQVDTIVRTRLSAGSHRLRWRDLPEVSGLYFVRISTGEEQMVRKVMIR